MMVDLAILLTNLVSYFAQVQPQSTPTAKDLNMIPAVFWLNLATNHFNSSSMVHVI